MTKQISIISISIKGGELLPAVIYLPAPLPNIIYVLPDYRELLPSPKSYLALPESKQLLNITAPISYPALKAPIEELNIIYILPKVFYMEPPLPSMFYLPGKIQACLPAPTIIRAPPYPEVNPTLPKPLCEKPDLPKVIYIEPSLPNMIHLPGKVSVLRDNHFKFIRILLILLLICIKDFWFVFSAVDSLLFFQYSIENPNFLSYQENEILETEIECISSSDSDYIKISEDTSSELDKSSYLWNKYFFLALGLIAFSLAFWYWSNRSVDISSGGSTDNSSMTISAASPTENTPNFDDISSIRYEDRGFVRRSIRDSFFDDIRLSTQLRERNEDLALDSINLNIRSASRDEMIQRIHESDVSPNTAIDAVQALLRESAREVNTEIPPFSNALVPYNSVTDLVVYNPENIPIPATVDMIRYEIFIQYLDHYNAIIAAYGF